MCRGETHCGGESATSLAASLSLIPFKLNRRLLKLAVSLRRLSYLQSLSRPRCDTKFETQRSLEDINWRFNGGHPDMKGISLMPVLNAQLDERICDYAQAILHTAAATEISKWRTTQKTLFLRNKVITTDYFHIVWFWLWRALMD